MNFWMSTLSTSIGAFVGVIGAYGIAKMQIEKTQRENHAEYYHRFNLARYYINEFDEKAKEIIYILQEERKYARKILTTNDFIEMRGNLTSAIKIINPQTTDQDVANFIVTFGKINIKAPLPLYRDTNDMFFWMGVIYNNLLHDSRNLVMHLPESILIHSAHKVPINVAVKRFRKKYSRLKKVLKI